MVFSAGDTGHIAEHNGVAAAISAQAAAILALQNGPGADTGWIANTGFTIQTGWTMTLARYRVKNGIAAMKIIATRTGTTLTGSATGDLADTSVILLPSTIWPLDDYSGSGTSTLAGPLAGVHISSSTGILELISLHTGATILTTTGTLHCSAIWML